MENYIKKAAQAARLLTLGLALVFLGEAPALAQTAWLLPNGEQQYVDGNGAPYANGQVCFYIPSTLTAKVTWIDPNQATQNTSPCVTLDGNGRAIIYGSGQYRQRLYDQFGNLIWDQTTNGVGPNASSGATVFANVTALRANTASVATGNLLNYSTTSDAGGGQLYVNSADTTSADNGCTIFVDAANHRWYRQQAQGTINIVQCGADASGVAASDTALAAAYGIAVLNGTYTNIFFPPGGTYQLNNQYTWRVDLAGINCGTNGGAELNFAGMSSSGTAFTFQGLGSGTPYNYDNYELMQGCRIVGPGSSTSSTLMYFNTAAEGGTSHLTVTNSNLSGFGTIASIGNNAYLISFNQDWIWNCGAGLNIPSGLTNYSENIQLTNTTIASCATAIADASPYPMVSMFGGALDYNTTNQVAITNGGIVELFGTNVEAQQFSGGYDFTVAGNGSKFLMHGGALSHAATAPDANLAVVFVGTNAIAEFRDVFMNNLLDTSKVFAAGSGGYVYVDGRTTYNPSTVMPYYLGGTGNFSTLIDQGFESAGAAGTVPFDDWEILLDTATITNRLSGTNVAIAVSGTQAHTGSYSLKFTKTTANAAGEFGVIVPIQGNRRYNFTGYYYVNSGSSGGVCYITLYYARILHGAGGVAIPLSSYTPGGGSITIPTSAVGWTALPDISPDAFPPSWATDAEILFNCYSVGSLTMYVDDILFTAY